MRIPNQLYLDRTWSGSYRTLFSKWVVSRYRLTRYYAWPRWRNFNEQIICTGRCLLYIDTEYEQDSGNVVNLAARVRGKRFCADSAILKFRIPSKCIIVYSIIVSSSISLISSKSGGILCSYQINWRRLPVYRQFSWWYWAAASRWSTANLK
jgi:hypothetical protein